MKQSLLWKLQKENHHTSFLFGTMHVKSQAAFQRIEQVKRILEDVDVFAAEYHLDEVQSHAANEHLFIPEGGKISDILSKKKFERIRNQLIKSFSIDLQLFDRFLPMVLVNFIGEAILSQEYNLPLDVYLWKYAKSLDKKLKGMETFESQRKILHNISLSDQIKMLKDLARNTGKYRKNIFRMSMWYEEEQIQKLYKNGKQSLGKYKHILLKNRNKKIAARFDQISESRSLFCAVGAGHLAGNYGILVLLKNNNWKLEAI
ncbi:TraB/GumN family protein [Portibacter marinus]|uniref:TraB/GumN family protein n=1 Tax=Portibacter marinus TaxID=2898660 RepID=UPI001F402D51|nr:TraB/GumN family protein [Portibacter marinus]